MTLFIGGSMDGRRENFTDRQTVYVAKYVPLRAAYLTSTDFPKWHQSWAVEKYILVALGRSDVFALENMTPDEIFRRLVDHYRPEK